MRIFVSYRRADSIGHAGRLYDELQSRFGRDTVFMDLSGIDAGEDFAKKIDGAIRQCDALIAVIGDEWLTCVEDGRRRLDRPDDFVRVEIATALQRGIPVVPLLVEGAKMPAARELPDPLKPLATRHAHELSDARWEYDVDRLVAALEKLAGKSRIGKRRAVAVAAAIALLAVAGAIVWIVTNRSAARDTIAGEWGAEVSYPWGAQHRETFSLKLSGNDLLGTASFLRVPRGIVNGTVDGPTIAFETRTQEVSGDWNNPTTVTHRYRGTLTDETIDFVMQSEGGSSSLPVEFTARRMTPADGAGAHPR